jgi:pilus assembly protein Flp/PilA
MFQHALAYVIAVLSAEKDEEKGASAVEYAILVAGIILVVTAAITAIGPDLTNRFGNLFA